MVRLGTRSSDGGIFGHLIQCCQNNVEIRIKLSEMSGFFWIFIWKAAGILRFSRSIQPIDFPQPQTSSME